MSEKFKCIFPRRINPLFVEPLPIVKCCQQIMLVQSDKDLDDALAEISAEDVLGFDTETRPSFSRQSHHKVAILQLAGQNKAWVIRLSPLAQRLPDIYKVLENPDIIKAGLAVQGDIRALSARAPLKAAGFVDVSSFTTKMGIINTGMKNLASVFFGERVSKTSQMSNWDAEELTQKQIDYAATDAWMSRRLYFEIKKVFDSGDYILEPEPKPLPEPFDFKKFSKKLYNSIKKLLNDSRRAVKKALLPKPPKRKRRRRGGRRRQYAETQQKQGR